MTIALRVLREPQMDFFFEISNHSAFLFIIASICNLQGSKNIEAEISNSS